MDLLQPFLGILLLCSNNPDKCLIVEQGSKIFIGLCLSDSEQYKLEYPEEISIPNNSQRELIISTRCTSV